MLRDSVLTSAIQETNPEFFDQVRTLAGAPIELDEKSLRILVTLRAYALRMTTRPTPLGRLSAIGQIHLMSGASAPTIRKCLPTGPSAGHTYPEHTIATSSGFHPPAALHRYGSVYELPIVDTQGVTGTRSLDAADIPGPIREFLDGRHTSRTPYDSPAPREEAPQQAFSAQLQQLVRAGMLDPVYTDDDRDNGDADDSSGGIGPSVRSILPTPIYEIAGSLPPSVLREVESAVGALIAASPPPPSNDWYGEYKARFIEKFGLHAIVPLTLLSDRLEGIGLPDYTVMGADPAAGREGWLGPLVSEALATGDPINLEKSMPSGLGPTSNEPLSMDFTAVVCASTYEHLVAGEFELVHMGGSPVASTQMARLLSGSPNVLRALAAELPVRMDGQQRVQLDMQPFDDRVRGLLPAGDILPIRIVRAGPVAQGRIPLRDLYVGCTDDGEHLYFFSRSLDAPILPTHFSVVSARLHRDPLVRFIHEVSLRNEGHWSSWHWGALANLSSLPKVIYGKTVLAPRRWNLDIPSAPPLDECAWSEFLGRWRDTYGVPETVTLTQGDRRLNVNFGSEADRLVIRKYAQGASRLCFSEPIPAGASGWLGDGMLPHWPDRPQEVTFPVVNANVVKSTIKPAAVAAGVYDFAPDYAWSSLHIRTVDTAMHQLIARELLEMLGDEGELCRESFFFVRYVEEGAPVLRVRFRTPNENDVVAGMRRRLSERFRREHLASRVELVDYVPERARYPIALSSPVEGVFHADSLRAISLLRRVPSAEQKRLLVCATALDCVALVAPCVGNWCEWSIERLPRLPGRASRYRPSCGWAEVFGASGSAAEDLDASSAGQALRNYLAEIEVPSRSVMNDCLSSMIHMSINRRLGPGIEQERDVLAVIRSAALELRARQACRSRQ